MFLKIKYINMNKYGPTLFKNKLVYYSLNGL